jgi:hypothetical protein
MQISEYHQQFPGSVRWRVVPEGVDVEGAGLIVPEPGQLSRAKEFVDRWALGYAAASAEFGVPVELILACSLTEAAVKDPAKSVRLEPRYVSDEQTPDRISAGLCQVLISTARTAMQDNSIDRRWLLGVNNSLRACAAYMKIQHDKQGTCWDPVLVACAYNAGGLYEQKGEKNRWRLRQYPIGTGNHADRFAAYFGAARRLADEGRIPAGFIPFRGLLPAS